MNLDARGKLQVLATRQKSLGGLMNQQPTKYGLYDEIDLTTGGQNGSIFQYFNDTNSKQFPITNNFTSTLTAGEALVIEFMSLAVVTYNTATANVLRPTAVTAIPDDTTFNGLGLGTFSMTISSAQIIKDCALIELYPQFNPNNRSVSIGVATNEQDATAFTRSQSIIAIESYPVITPNMQWQLNVKLPAYSYSPVANVRRNLRCTLHGFGTTVAPFRL